MFCLSQFNHQRFTSFSACTTQPLTSSSHRHRHTPTHSSALTEVFFFYHLLLKTVLCDVSVYQWVWLAACDELFRPNSLRQAGRLLFVNASTLLCLSVCLRCATHRNTRQYDNAGAKNTPIASERCIENEAQFTGNAVADADSSKCPLRINSNLK